MLLSNYLPLVSPLGKVGALCLNKVESPSPKDALCQVLIEIDQVVLDKKSLSFYNVFLLFRNYLPVEKSMVIYLNKLGSPSPKDAWCQVLIEIVLVVLENFLIYFCYFVLISPWKKDVDLQLIKLQFPLPKNALCQVWLMLAQFFFWKRTL